MNFYLKVDVLKVTNLSQMTYIYTLECFISVHSHNFLFCACYVNCSVTLNFCCIIFVLCSFLCINCFQ